MYTLILAAEGPMALTIKPPGLSLDGTVTVPAGETITEILIATAIDSAPISSVFTNKASFENDSYNVSSTATVTVAK
jgi:hypothetical protein